MSVASTILTRDEFLRLAELYTNTVWEFFFKDSLDGDEKDIMLHLAHGAALIYSEHGESLDNVRSAWLLSRVYAILGWGEIALHYARKGLALCEEHELDAFPRAFAHESMARACALLGDRENCLLHLKKSGEYSTEIIGEIEIKTLKDDLNEISSMISEEE